MPPFNNYSQKRAEAEQLIRAHTPERFQDQLIASLLPALSIETVQIDDSQILFGASKFGGSPDVPADFEWPTWNEHPLGFIAQINLEEVAPFDIHNQLPSSGLLWFFCSLNERNRVWGEAHQCQGWRVILGCNPTLRIEPPSNSYWIQPVRTQRVRFQMDWRLGDNSYEDWDWDEEEWSNFQWELLEKTPHIMLGSPYSPQLSPLIVAANGSGGANGLDLYNNPVSTDGWELLLQVNTGDGEFFDGTNDLGWLYFLVRREDLNCSDFSHVWFNSQST